MAASSSSPSSAFSKKLFGLPEDAPVEDIEWLLNEVTETLSRIDSKRGALQKQIAATTTTPGGKRRASSRRRPPPPVAGAAVAVAPIVVQPHLLPPPGNGVDSNAPPPLYTASRRGSALLRRRLRDAAHGAKKERKRLEAVFGDLEEALIDAKEWLALRRGRTA